MLDVALLRKDLAGVAARLRQRGFELDCATLEQLEADRKSVQTAPRSCRHGATRCPSRSGN